MSSILRNFGLTADEIRVMEAIRELTNALENIQFTDSQSPKAELFCAEIESSKTRSKGSGKIHKLYCHDELIDSRFSGYGRNSTETNGYSRYKQLQKQ